MKGLYKFLALYSLIATTTLFFASLIFMPRPENFLFLLLFLPTAAFFWLNGPRKIVKRDPTSEANSVSTSPRIASWVGIVLLTLLISNLTLYSYLTWGSKTYLRNNQQLDFDNSPTLKDVKELLLDYKSKESSSGAILKDLEKIKGEVDDLKRAGDLKNEVLGVNLSEPPSLSEKESSASSKIPSAIFITIATSRWQTLDVFKDKVSSSQIIAQIEYGKNYPVIKKDPGWYKITLPSGREGWVKDQYLKEVLNP